MIGNYSKWVSEFITLKTQTKFIEKYKKYKYTKYYLI